mmetsp:Transcript_26993/g.80035  ORF Transcript_26993/g.80035 Transcript_26993/m.80035 type:complete len:224 (-) Transcript_26993:828-1499(-)
MRIPVHEQAGEHVHRHQDEPRHDAGVHVQGRRGRLQRRRGGNFGYRPAGAGAHDGQLADAVGVQVQPAARARDLLRALPDLLPRNAQRAAADVADQHGHRRPARRLWWWKPPRAQRFDISDVHPAAVQRHRPAHVSGDFRGHRNPGGRLEAEPAEPCADEGQECVAQGASEQGDFRLGRVHLQRQVPVKALQGQGWHGVGAEGGRDGEAGDAAQGRGGPQASD